MGSLPSKPIDFKIIADYVLSASEESDYIISVGSGCGQLENYIEKKIGKTIICIDPKPESSINGNYHGNNCTKIIKSPNYGMLDDFLNEVQTKDKKITLMLIWSPPNGYDGTNNDYDIEAIFKLKPSNIIILYDVTGCAGSSFLHYWLGDIKNLYGFFDYTTPLKHPIYHPESYHLTAEYTHLGEDGSYTLLYLSREAAKKELPHGVYKYL